MKRELTITNFLRRLKEQFKISSIFYPGADTDTVLEGPFTLREIFYLDNDLQIHEANDLISQGVAALDFEDDGSGKAGSVTVRRVLDNSIIFYSKDEQYIKKFLN